MKSRIFIIINLVKRNYVKNQFLDIACYYKVNSGLFLKIKNTVRI